MRLIHSQRRNNTFPEGTIRTKEVFVVVGVAAEVIPMAVEVGGAVSGEVDPIRMVATNIMSSLEIIIKGTIITIEAGVAGVVGSLITTLVQQFKVVMPQLMLGCVHDHIRPLDVHMVFVSSFFRWVV